MKMKKVTALLVAAVMVTGLLYGCGGDADTDEEQDTRQAEADDEAGETDSAADSDQPYAGVTLKYAVSETQAEGAETEELVNLVREETGIEIEFQIVPVANAGEVDKTLVSLQAGDELDILYAAEPKLKTYYSAGVLESLDELAEGAGYNMTEVFGDNVAVFDDGLAYGLPAFSDIWLTFYNKKVFDDAGVAYPEADGWTWEKYVETAKQLTNADEDIWGSLMLDYDCYNYMWATQMGAEPYKEDGTSNFDDPLYQQSVEFFYSLGNDEKIQPDSTLYASGIYPWNSFVAGDNFGMFVCGGWVSSMLPDFDSYPREWECGILPMPYPEGTEPSTLAVNGCYGVPTTSKNKEAAFEAIRCIAENQYTLGYGRVPARVDLTDEEITAYIEEHLMPAFEADNITVEEIKAGWFDADRKLCSEKIIGTADSTINQIWIEEGQLYGQGVKSIEDTMASLKERSDAAIEEEINYGQ